MKWVIQGKRLVPANFTHFTIPEGKSKKLIEMINNFPYVMWVVAYNDDGTMRFHADRKRGNIRIVWAVTETGNPRSIAFKQKKKGTIYEVNVPSGKAQQ
jgi:hypothetical protein